MDSKNYLRLQLFICVLSSVGSFFAASVVTTEGEGHDCVGLSGGGVLGIRFGCLGRRSRDFSLK